MSRKDTSDFIGESFYLSIVINLPWFTVEFLQIPLRFSVAVDNALLTLKFCFDPQQYRQRNWIERMFNRLKQFRRIATRYEKRADNYLAMLNLAAILLWL